MKFIAAQDELAALVLHLKRFDSIAVDTEADSLHHYFEKLCLIQISSPEENFIVDPLTELDLTPLTQVLGEREVLCHGADFDVRMLRKFGGYQPGRVFDTMLAAQFAGYPRPSLAALVEQHFAVVLSKANQKADWSKRPLTQSMLDYAVNDTRYLLRIKDILTAQLKELGRLAWYEEMTQVMVAQTAVTRQSDPDELWRIKGSKDVHGRALALVKELWHWREEEAKRRDRPRFKVLSTEQIIPIANWIDQHPEQSLWECGVLPMGVRERKPVSLEEAAARAFATDPGTLARAKKKGLFRRWTKEQEARLQKLKDERKRLSEELKMDASLICTNAVLEAVVGNDDGAADRPQELFQNWQWSLMREAVTAVETADPSSGAAQA
jgi:ribonuclease D